MTAAANPRPVLKDGAVYFSDNGRTICAKCAGASARFTGRDISGQKVQRATVGDAAEWREQIGRDLGCEMGCTTLSTIAGPDGWPLTKAGAR